MRKKMRFCAVMLLAAVCVFCAACGGGGDTREDGKTEAVTAGETVPAQATTMWLTKTEGSVGVTDDSNAAVPVREQVGLYSGYGVDTAGESYAWINLDDVKLTKMDADSEIAIQKQDKALGIEVKKGSLFFHVTQPLSDDESMEIRTSTTVVGIRGTCGWVAVDEWEHLELYLLEGQAEYTFHNPETGESESITIAGSETVKLARQDDGSFAFETGYVWEDEFPAFVAWEGEENETVRMHMEEMGLSAGMFTGSNEPETEPEKQNVVLTMPVTSGDIAAAVWNRNNETVTIRSNGEPAELELNFVSVGAGQTLIIEEGINVRLANPPDFNEEEGKGPNLTVSGTVIVKGNMVIDAGMLYINGGRLEVSGDIESDRLSDILVENGPGNPDGDPTIVVGGVLRNSGYLTNNGTIEGEIE